MNSSDIVKLAGIFDEFISLGSSVVKLKDISAIKKVTNGIEVVTANGTFKDTVEYERLIVRVQDALEVLKTQDRHKEIIKEALANPVPATPVPRPIGTAAVPALVPVDQSERKVIKLDPGVMQRRTIISVGAQGAQGNLFSADSNLVIVEREKLVILDPNDNILAQPATGVNASSSSVTGNNDEVSGFIYNSGKYALSFKNYPHREAVVVYSVRQKPELNNVG